jgi:hypothetical protein
MNWSGPTAGGLSALVSRDAGLRARVKPFLRAAASTAAGLGVARPCACRPDSGRAGAGCAGW